MEGIDICNGAADEVRVVGPESSLPMQQEADGWPGRFLAKRLCKDVAAADCLPLCHWGQGPTGSWTQELPGAPKGKLPSQMGTWPRTKGQGTSGPCPPLSPKILSSNLQGPLGDCELPGPSAEGRVSLHLSSPLQLPPGLPDHPRRTMVHSQGPRQHTRHLHRPQNYPNGGALHLHPDAHPSGDYLETRNFHVMFILKFQHTLAVCGVVIILGFTSCAIPVSLVSECTPTTRQAETLGHGLKPPAWSWPFRPKMLGNLCGAGGPWGTDGSRDRLESAQKTQVEAVADSFIALGRGGQRLRSSWWGGSASSSPSQASGCAGWRWLCGWRPGGKAGSGHLPWELVPPTLCSQSTGPAPQSGEDRPSRHA